MTAAAAGHGTPPGEPTAAEVGELVGVAAELAREAGALLLGYYDGSTPRADLAETIRSKSTRTDLVTAADRASESLICSRLSELRPGDAVLAEEGGGRPGQTGLTWVVDPLDGTINFVYGFPAFAVSIGCERNGMRLAGAVFDPLRRELFTAGRGLGARLGDLPLGIGDGPPLEEALVSTGFGYSADRRSAQARLLQALLPSVRDIRRAGAAALDLCWVATGRVDAFYEAGLAPWDLSAGALVVSEAGGVVERLAGVVPSAETVVAGPPRLARELASLLEGASATSGTGEAAAPTRQ
jgi:myo-inositol-1(or 4)-monophosphatase